MRAMEPPDRLTLHRGLSVPADQAEDFDTFDRRCGRAVFYVQLGTWFQRYPYSFNSNGYGISGATKRPCSSYIRTVVLPLRTAPCQK